MDTDLWHAQDVSDVYTALRTSKQGLSRAEILGRLQKYGLNKLQTKEKTSLLKLLLRQFKSPFVYLLVGAAILSTILGELSDTYIILGAVVITVGFGFFQEAKAERTLEALQAVIHKTARVIRDGRVTEVDALRIVPGDILVLAEGDRVPVDARLIEVTSFAVDEATLTGESLSQEKTSEAVERGAQVSDRSNMVYRGTVAVKGRALAVVVATGSQTEIGGIATTVSEIGEEATPLQKKLTHLAHILTYVVLGSLVLLVVTGIVRGVPVGELLITSVAVAVAAIPESLIAVMTVILAVGMVRLLKARALVRKLVAAETLGSVSVICVDKTGTLTEGNMSIDHIFCISDSCDENFAISIGMTTNEAYFDMKPGESMDDAEARGDPTETSFLHYGREQGLLEDFKKREGRIISELPFESDNQYMATLVREEEEHNRLYVKGSPEKLLGNADRVWMNGKVETMTQEHKEQLEKQITATSQKGFRLIAVGYRDVGKTISTDNDKIELLDIAQLGDNPLQHLVLVGIVAITDPLRKTVVETIRIAEGAGVRVVMITGDHRLTAQTIAQDIGLVCEKHNILMGDELAEMSDDDLKAVAPHINVYARIVPNDKLRIVRALQADGLSVAMTGDGVNDAPALKQADIGVAMGSGSDVAKEASDVVILDNRFETIVHAVKEGRVIVDNIRKVTLYLLKDSFSEIILLATAIIAGLPLPIVAAQVLWINIVEDGFPSFALAYEPPEDDVMTRAPESHDQPLLTREMRVIIFAVGIFTDLLLLGIFVWFYLADTLSIEYIRTIVFAGLALHSLFVIFSLKSLRTPLHKIPILNNWYLIASVIFGLGMLLVAMYVPFFRELLALEPLQFSHWLLVTTVALLQVGLIELVKWWFVHGEHKKMVQQNA